VNGIHTKRSSAVADLEDLWSLNINNEPGLIALDSKKNVETELSYNQNVSFLLDIAESAVQKLIIEKGVAKDDAWHIVYTALSLGNLSIIPLANFNLALLDLLDFTLPSLSELSNQESVTSEYLKSVIKKNLSNNKKLLIVSHSQGGLFVNSAYSDLISQNPLYLPVNKTFNELNGLYRNFQIATPASSVLMPGTHLTNVYDFIRTVPDSLTPNISFAFPTLLQESRSLLERELNHSFSQTYLSQVGSLAVLRNKVSEVLVLEASKLISNCVGRPEAHFTYSSRAGKPPFANPMLYDFDASTSTDPDEPPPGTSVPAIPDYDIVDFTWVIDGNNIRKGMRLLYFFQTEGWHTVQLTVTDATGNVSEPYTQEIFVENLAPIATFTHSVDDMTVNFDASGSRDPDGWVYMYLWKIGGTIYTTLEPHFSHTFLSLGNHGVELVVVDNNGKFSPIYQVPVKVGAENCEDPEHELYPYYPTAILNISTGTPYWFEDRRTFVNKPLSAQECKLPESTRTSYLFSEPRITWDLADGSPLDPSVPSPTLSYAGCAFDGNVSRSVFRYEYDASKLSPSSGALDTLMYCAEDRPTNSQVDRKLVAKLSSNSLLQDPQFFSLYGNPFCYIYQPILRTGFTTRMLPKIQLPKEDCSDCQPGTLKVNGVCTCPAGLIAGPNGCQYPAGCQTMAEYQAGSCLCEKPYRTYNLLQATTYTCQPQPPGIDPFGSYARDINGTLTGNLQFSCQRQNGLSVVSLTGQLQLNSVNGSVPSFVQVASYCMDNKSPIGALGFGAIISGTDPYEFSSGFTPTGDCYRYKLVGINGFTIVWEQELELPDYPFCH
jgi:PKD repeat protein